MRLLCGQPALLGKAIIAQVRAALAQPSTQIIVLVPEQFTLQAELDILDALSNETAAQGSFRVQVLSITRLCTRTFEATGEPEGVPVDERGRAMLLGAALDDCHTQLSWYAQARSSRTTIRPGFTRRALQQIAELKSADITADMLRGLTDSSDNPNLRAKLNDISHIYDSYQQLVAGHFVDADDRLQECIAHMDIAAANPATDMLHNAQVLIYGFEFVTPPLQKLSVALCRHARAVTMLMALPPERELARVYSPVRDSVNRLHIALHMQGLDLEEHTLESGPAESDALTPACAQDDLAHLSRHLFASGAYSAWDAPTPKLRLQLLRDPFDEAMEVAAQIRALVQSGWRYRDIAVVSPLMDSYRHCLLRAFSLYDVPVFLSQPRALASQPLPRYLLAALRCVSVGFRQEDALECLKSGFGLPADEAELLENYIIERGISGKRLLRPFKYGNADLLETLAPIRERFVAPLNALQSRLKAASTIAQQAEAIYLLLCECGADTQLHDRERELKELNRMREAAESAQVWNKLIEWLDQLHLLLGERPADIALLCSLARDAFENSELRVLPQSPDSVSAGRLGHLKLQNVKALFIIGLQEASSDPISGLLSDAERAEVEEQLGAHLSLSAEQTLILEQLDTLSSIAKADRLVVFSHCMNDLSGAPYRPGQVIARVKRLFPKLHERGVTESAATLPLRLSAPRAAIAELAPICRIGLNEDTLPPAAQAAWVALGALNAGANAGVNTDSPSPAAFQGTRILERALKHDSSSEPLGRALAAQVYNISSAAHMNVTQLEQFARCPFSHFVSYGLRPCENRTYELEQRDKGSFYHDAIERFTRASLERGGMNALTPEQAVALMDDVTARLQVEWADKMPLREDSVMRARARSMVRVARRAAQAMVIQLQGSGFEPAMLEVEFGSDHELTLTLPALDSEGAVTLTGRIDRVDLLSAPEIGLKCLRVVDYKLGTDTLQSGRTVNLTQVYHGLQLQLLLYLCAALNMRLGYDPAAALYFTVKDPVVPGDDLDDEQLESTRIRSLQLRGLVVDDPEIISRTASDPTRAIPLTPTAHGYRSAEWLVTPEQLQLLMFHAYNQAGEIAGLIAHGVSDAAPANIKGFDPCQNCDYADICQFDLSLPGSDPRLLSKLQAEEVFELIAEEFRAQADEG